MAKSTSTVLVERFFFELFLAIAATITMICLMLGAAKTWKDSERKYEDPWSNLIESYMTMAAVRWYYRLY